MRARSVEHVVRVRRLGPKLRLRVDLHGVSVFGPGKDHTLIRWEWIERIEPGTDGVVVSSAAARLRLPRGAFGLEPDALAQRLEQARSITLRPDVIGGLQPG